MSSKVMLAAIAVVALIGCGSTEEQIYIMSPDGAMLQTERMDPKVQELEKLPSRDADGGGDCVATCYASKGYCTCSGARACCQMTCSGCLGY